MEFTPYLSIYSVILFLTYKFYSQKSASLFIYAKNPGHQTY